MNKENVNIGIYVSSVHSKNQAGNHGRIMTPHGNYDSLDWLASVHQLFSEKTTEWVLTYLLPQKHY